MDGWNTNFRLEWPIFRGYVSFREGIANDYLMPSLKLGAPPPFLEASGECSFGRGEL